MVEKKFDAIRIWFQEKHALAPGAEMIVKRLRGIPEGLSKAGRKENEDWHGFRRLSYEDGCPEYKCERKQVFTDCVRFRREDHGRGRGNGDGKPDVPDDGERE